MNSVCSDRLKPAGFPHSEISGSRVICTSPELIAAYHVLHRLHAPRHPPCALSSLTIKFAQSQTRSAHRSLTPSLLRYTEPSSDSSRIPRRVTTFFGNFAYSIIKEHSIQCSPEAGKQNLLAAPARRLLLRGGGEGIRTPDPMVANHVL